MKKLLITLLSAVAFAATGTAASADQKSWTGLSIGVGGGGGALVSDITAVPGTLLPPGTFDVGLDGLGSSGGFGTVGAALDYQFAKQWVIGAFIDYDFGDIDTEFSANFGAIGINAKYELEDVWTIGGRIGFLPSQNTLVYGLIGYSEASVTDLAITAPGFAASVGVPSFEGFTVGGGIETVLFPNVTLKGEYRYTEFDRESLNLEAIAPGAGAFVDVRSEPVLHTGRVSINYKFNFDRSVEPAPLK